MLVNNSVLKKNHLNNCVPILIVKYIHFTLSFVNIDIRL